MKKLVSLIFFIILFQITYSQCAMCKAVVESEMENGTIGGSGINSGIIYLMIIPYILIAGVGYLLYLNYKKNNSISEAE